MGKHRGCVFGMRALLYNRRSWAKVSRWAGDMLQLWQRLRADLPCPDGCSEECREALAANCAFCLAGMAPSKLNLDDPHDITAARKACLFTAAGSTAEECAQSISEVIEWVAVD